MGKKFLRVGCSVSHPQLYNSWRGMWSRCTEKSRWDAQYYSGKGVTICQEWEDLSVFCDWALANGYQPGLTIDRIDVNGGYSPRNCRWADRKVQAANRTSAHLITVDGMTKSLLEWSRFTGVNWGTILTRLRQLGWSEKEAVYTPARPLRKSA